VVGGAPPGAAKTVSLTGGECFTTPNPPTSFSATRGASGSQEAVLSWVKPNFNTDGTPIGDLAGYEIRSARCTNWASSACAAWADWVSTTLDDAAAQSYTWPGLVVGDRYKFQARALDSCATPSASDWTGESSIVRVR
jgi:hypothetical protein